MPEFKVVIKSRIFTFQTNTQRNKENLINTIERGKKMRKNKDNIKRTQNKVVEINLNITKRVIITVKVNGINPSVKRNS